MVVGDCYYEAAEFVIANPSYQVVHGRPTGQGPIAGLVYGHAWAERDGFVTDVTMPQLPPVITVTAYYLAGNIDPAVCHRYTRAEAIKFMLSHKHYGPWEGEEACPPTT